MSTPPPLPFQQPFGQYGHPAHPGYYPVNPPKRSKGLIFVAIGSSMFALLMLVILIATAVSEDRTVSHEGSGSSDTRQYSSNRQNVENQLSQVRQTLASTVAEKAQHRAKVQAYISNHKMAVFAIAAGVVAGQVAWDKNNEFSEDAEALGGFTVAIAIIYAAANFEEVSQVAQTLGAADIAQKQYDSRIASLNGQLSSLQRQL